jgi:gas vesicle protein
MKNNSGNTLIALLTGAIIGTGIGILFAPDKGTETRKKIKDKALDAKSDIQERMHHAKEELTKTVDQKKEAFEDKLEVAISNMSLKADDIINALEHKLETLKKKNAQFQK